jgi:glyceraldehyde 3-phosphate dehydrogenase
MSVRIGINGFGRIGRLVFRAARDANLEVVAVNDLHDAATLAHLLKYDSVHGIFEAEVGALDDALVVDGRKIPVSAERDPGGLPWRSLGVAIAIEASGHFTDREDAGRHLEAGAERVLITAPARDADLTVVLGVNDGSYDADLHHIVSNASCTTNCLAPVAKVLNDSFGIINGWMTTIHAVTNDQVVLDSAHRDLRRARTASASMIPTSTGAARAISLVLPELEGKLDGFAMRVPTPDVSAVDLSVRLERASDAESINAALREASQGSLRGVLQVCDEPLVSIDFQGNPHSSIVDGPSTKVMDGDFAKLLAWYDNEWGYASRVVELAVRMGRGR